MDTHPEVPQELQQAGAVVILHPEAARDLPAEGCLSRLPPALLWRGRLFPLGLSLGVKFKAHESFSRGLQARGQPGSRDWPPPGLPLSQGKALPRAR